ncbi:hypothetical protein [Sinorhizobium meliloti]|nr:hypothetical protein U8C39_09660 [Sinorhizobium meliloti]WQP31722.1 hypothetical protein U8C45_09625 [Sinorhizobium meliloti]
MNNRIHTDLLRYEEMVGLCDGSNPDDLEEACRDRAQYGNEYGSPTDERGRLVYSPARIVRFLIEVCGHSYNDALQSVIEDMRSWPTAPARAEPDAHHEASAIRSGSQSIIEALFDLKVVRLAHGEDSPAIDHNWLVTRTLMGMERRDITPVS